MNQSNKSKEKLARVLADCPDEYATYRINNCDSKPVLRECLKYEAEHECRQERIAALNAQIMRL